MQVRRATSSITERPSRCRLGFGSLLLSLLGCQDFDRIGIPEVARPAPHRRRRDQILPAFEDALQIPVASHENTWQDGQDHRRAHQTQLQEGVDLTDLRRPDLRTRQAEIPVSPHRLRRRQTDPAEVDCRDSQSDIAPENDDGKPDRKDVSNGQADDGDGHEELIGHRVDDCADDGLGVVAAG